METHAYGLPILTTKTLDGWLEEEGLVWPDIRPPVPLNDWVGEEVVKFKPFEIAGTT